LRTFVATRLNPKKDCDIISAINGIESGELSRLIRKGLRLVLNSRKDVVKQSGSVFITQQQVVKQSDQTLTYHQSTVKQPAKSAPEQQKNQPEKLVWKL